MRTRLIWAMTFTLFTIGFILGIPLKKAHTENNPVCGKSGVGVTKDGRCRIKSHDQYNGWSQSRVTEWMDCSHIYMHCESDDWKGWHTEIMLESPPLKEK